jgi:hypothetical protein
LRTIESAISLAQADGKTIPSDEGADFYGLVPNYLAAKPNGPTGAAYSIVSSRAVVTLTPTSGKIYGATLAAAGGYKLEELSGLSGW